MALVTREELLATLVPYAVYWIYSGIYVVFESKLDKYKLHSKKEEEEKNLVSRKAVFKAVVIHQIMSIVMNLFIFAAIREKDGEASPRKPLTMLALVKQVIIAMLVIDTWAFFVHWYLHQNKFLYRHIHIPHHRLVVPYSFGGHYMHPIEGILDTMGGTLAVLLSGMSPRTSTFFVSFTLIKVVDDHCGMKLPGNPFNLLSNNSAYHDVHHQLYGTKYNFSVYFDIWDKILGTYMPYTLEKTPEGRLEVRRADIEHKHD
ncbi:Sphinganine C(4)-monooxygenase 2 [Hibiscus syriacus]|uniref:Sphinganine C(4)-monooxygenase 2 n=1 Tax=Hibiscus syriacus TaxID=106335 RepID=A0A6A2YIF2_HIBSY|nr:sphinganine C4-monooxygenase 2-like isoform X1 [Hibiscus syriacus]XP_039029299.1 sphinganine C4-monooxygenase 2-like isoform X2 [Hibiscus syriacus]KAE8678109.1 Sphinganine C(4)-monooxygenase 2 [Hibiscus syriacus]